MHVVAQFGRFQQHGLGRGGLAAPVEHQAQVGQRGQRAGHAPRRAQLGHRPPAFGDGRCQVVAKAQHAGHGGVEVGAVFGAAFGHGPGALVFQRLHGLRFLAGHGQAPGAVAREGKGQRRFAQSQGLLDGLQPYGHAVGELVVGFPALAQQQHAQALAFVAGQALHALQLRQACGRAVGCGRDAGAVPQHFKHLVGGSRLLETEGRLVEQRALLHRP